MVRFSSRWFIREYSWEQHLQERKGSRTHTVIQLQKSRQVIPESLGAVTGNQRSATFRQGTWALIPLHDEPLDVGCIPGHGSFQPKAIPREGPSCQPQQPSLPETGVMSMRVLGGSGQHTGASTTQDRQKQLVKDYMIWQDLINYKKESRKEGANFASLNYWILNYCLKIFLFGVCLSYMLRYKWISLNKCKTLIK